MSADANKLTRNLKDFVYIQQDNYRFYLINSFFIFILQSNLSLLKLSFSVGLTIRPKF
jgi:hypothetical protein